MGSKMNDSRRMEEKRRGRTIIAMLLAMAMPLVLLALAAGHASATDFSGKWVSATPGEGLIQEDVVSKRYFDWEWTITVHGSYAEASGSYTLTRDIPYGSYDPWSATIGITYPYYNPDIAIVEDHLVIDWAKLEPGESSGAIILYVSGNKMYGSGSYIDSGTLIFYEYNLKRAGFLGIFDLSSGGIVPLACLGFVAVFVVIIAAVLKPAPMTPSIIKGASEPRMYQPSDVRTTEDYVPVGLPEGELTPMTGVGVTVPPPPPQGRPLPPKEHFSRTWEPPRCPIHNDVALVAHYMYPEGDPGSWYCPKCRGYPWGRS